MRYVSRLVGLVNLRARMVTVRSWLGKAGQEIAINVGGAPLISDGVMVGGRNPSQHWTRALRRLNLGRWSRT